MNEVTTTSIPLCEECGASPSSSFSHFVDPATNTGSWKFCCGCTSGKEDYYIEFSRFFGSQSETMNWLAHMDEKTWMDWHNFMQMVQRYRAAVPVS